MTVLTIRGALAAAAALLVATACRDIATSTPSSSEPAAVLSGGTGAPGDTTRGTTPPAPAPASVTDLTVHVGVAVAGVDTLRSTPLANAKVSVFSITTTSTPGAGGDTLTVVETLVATGSTDASGDVVLGGLAPLRYRIDAAPGGGGAGASVRIAPPYAAATHVALIVRPSA